MSNTDLALALFIVEDEVKEGSDILAALDHAARVIRDDRRFTESRPGKHARGTIFDRPTTARCTRPTIGSTCRDFACPRHHADVYGALGGERGERNTGCGHVPVDVRMYGDDGTICADCWF